MSLLNALTHIHDNDVICLYDCFQITTTSASSWIVYLVLRWYYRMHCLSISPTLSHLSYWRLRRVDAGTWELWVC